MVDDDEIDISNMARCLAKSTLANDSLPFTEPREFLGHMALVAAGQAPMPSIVFMDISMPTMNGFDVVTQLRRHEPLRDIPVVMFLSNSDNPNDIARAHAMGADYQEKFSNVSECVAFLDSLAGSPPQVLR
jgi:CheY-like chemotaxis protein